MATDQELRCVISDVMDQVRDRDAEIARLTAERDAALDQVRQMIQKAADEKLDGYRELGSRAAQAENERDAAIARAERAERVAVWAVRRGAEADHNEVFMTGDHLPDDQYIEAVVYDGTDADLYRALVEACEGGRDGD